MSERGRLTSRERILSDLRRARGGWFCGASWYASFVPTYAQRISNLNAATPGLIESRPCKRHQHRGGIHEYRLAPAERLGLSA